MQLGTVAIIATALTTLSAGAVSLSNSDAAPAGKRVDLGCAVVIGAVLDNTADAGPFRLTEVISGERNATNVLVSIPGVGRSETNVVEGQLRRDLVVRDGKAWERLDQGGWQELPKLRTMSEMIASDGDDWPLGSMSNAVCLTVGSDVMTFHFTTTSSVGTEAWTVRADRATFRPLAIESISDGPKRSVTNWTYEYDATLTISPPTIHL